MAVMFTFKINVRVKKGVEMLGVVFSFGLNVA